MLCELFVWMVIGYVFERIVLLSLFEVSVMIDFIDWSYVVVGMVELICMIV